MNVFKIMLHNFSTESPGSKNIIVNKLNRIMTIGINKPEKRNCIDARTAEELEESIKDFENDDTTVAAVLYGLGGNFCAGYDFNEISGCSDDDSKVNVHMPFTHRLISKPIVAALSGYSVAEGLELALMCDLRVMEETAVLGLYARRFGIPLSNGATVRLQSMIGLSRALDLILTGRSVNAKEAFEWGLANRIVACGTGLGQAINLATSLIKFPQKCILSDRELTYNAAYNSAYQELLQEEIKRNHTDLKKDAIEGAKKFLDGLGKHGKTYNLTEKPVCEWEKEFDLNKSKL